MRWATRRGCHVDRASCAWLIRRFIDPRAEFVFIDDPDEVPADARAFDLRGAELSHHEGGCSFETFLRRYQLADPALEEAAKRRQISAMRPGRQSGLGLVGTDEFERSTVRGRLLPNRTSTKPRRPL